MDSFGRCRICGGSNVNTGGCMDCARKLQDAPYDENKRLRTLNRKLARAARDGADAYALLFRAAKHRETAREIWLNNRGLTLAEVREAAGGDDAEE